MSWALRVGWAVGIVLLALAALCWGTVAALSPFGVPHVVVNGVPWSPALAPWPMAGGWGAAGGILALLIAALALPLAVVAPLLIVGLIVAAALIAALILAAGILALVVSPLLVVLGVAWVVWRVARAACGARRADVGARMAG